MSKRTYLKIIILMLSVWHVHCFDDDFIEDEHGNRFQLQSHYSTPEVPDNEPSRFTQDFSHDVSSIFSGRRLYNVWHSRPRQPYAVPFYIGPGNSYHPRGKNRFVQKFSRYEYNNGRISIRGDYKNLIQTFCNEVVRKHTCMRVDWSSDEASWQTLQRLRKELLTNRRLYKKALGRLEKIFGRSYLCSYIDSYERGIHTNVRREERKEHKTIARRRVDEKLSVDRAIDDVSQVLIERYHLLDGCQELAVDKREGAIHEWASSELRLQQQDVAIKLSDDQKEMLEEMRFVFYRQRDTEASRVYMHMLKQVEIESYQHDGMVSKKIYRRLAAVSVARANGFKVAQGNYVLNKHAHTHAPAYICKALQVCDGNSVQHNVHEEVVSFVNRYSYYVHAHGKDGAHLYECADIALRLKQNLDGGEPGIYTKIYERTYQFLDFCHNLLKVKVGRGILYTVQRCGMGLEQGGLDIKRVLATGWQGYQDNKLGESVTALLHGTCDIHDLLEENRVFMDAKQKELGAYASKMLDKVRNQPLGETLGDALQCLSRRLVHVSAIIVVTLGIVTAVETGVVAATGVAGAVVSKRILQSFSPTINPSGTVALEQAVSTGASIWQEVVMALGAVSQGLYGLVDAARGLCWGMQGDLGNIVDEEKVGRRPIIFDEKQLQKKFKHAKFFGVDCPWNKHAVVTYQKALLDFINSEETEVMQALFRKDPAIYYINKNSGLFVVKISGKYRTGWKLDRDQLIAFLRSGNLN